MFLTKVLGFPIPAEKILNNDQLVIRNTAEMRISVKVAQQTTSRCCIRLILVTIRRGLARLVTITLYKDAKRKSVQFSKYDR